MDADTVVRSLAALAQPVRLQVFRALVVSGRAGLTPGTMAEALDIPTNTLSFHLKELTPRRPGDAGAFEPPHHLPGRLRPHERAARLPHRKLLRRRLVRRRRGQLPRLIRPIANPELP